MKFRYLAPEELEVVRSLPTILLERMLDAKRSLLSYLRKNTSVDNDWPPRIREVIKAIEDELSRRDRDD